MSGSSYGCGNNNSIPVLDGMRYFYSKTDTCNFVPRLEITMVDALDISKLQTAAEKAMARYRIFRLVTQSNEYDYYLVDNTRPPIVHIDDGTRHVAGTEENNGHLTWIGIRGRTLIVEFFHGISDIHGTIPFVKFLLQCYCTLRYGTVFSTEKSAESLLEDSTECMDSMLFVNEPISTVPRKKAQIAFQLPDERIEEEKPCALYSLIVDAAKFDAYMRQNRSSRTAVFSLFMNHAIAEIHPNHESKIVAGVGADVRKIYGAEKTLRDCTDILSVWFDSEIAAMPFEEQLRSSRKMIVDAMQPDLRLAYAMETKQNNALLLKKIPLLENRKRFCKKIHRYSYLNHTYNISNVGRVSFGGELDAYVCHVEAIMAANAYLINMEIVQYKQEYRIIYCSRLKNDPYIQRFHNMFLQEGIPCTCERREDYSETLAVF